MARRARNITDEQKAAKAAWNKLSAKDKATMVQEIRKGENMAHEATRERALDWMANWVLTHTKTDPSTIDKNYLKDRIKLGLWAGSKQAPGFLPQLQEQVIEAESFEEKEADYEEYASRKYQTLPETAKKKCIAAGKKLGMTPENVWFQESQQLRKLLEKRRSIYKENLKLASMTGTNAQHYWEPESDKGGKIAKAPDIFIEAPNLFDILQSIEEEEDGDEESPTPA